MDLTIFFNVLSRIESPVDYLNLVLAYPEFLKEEAWRWNQTDYQKFGWKELNFQQIYQQYRQQERNTYALLFMEQNHDDLKPKRQIWVRMADIPSSAWALLRQVVLLEDDRDRGLYFSKSVEGYSIRIVDLKKCLRVVGSFTPDQIFRFFFHLPIQATATTRNNEPLSEIPLEMKLPRNKDASYWIQKIVDDYSGYL